jgi:hypothetical protein
MKSFVGNSVGVLDTRVFRAKTAVYRLRYLLMKKGRAHGLAPAEENEMNALLESVAAVREGEIGSESECVRAVCMCLARNEDRCLKQILDVLLADRVFERGIPLYAIPDLVETVRSAGLANRKFDLWREKALEKGLLNLNLRREDERHVPVGAP